MCKASQHTLRTTGGEPSEAEVSCGPRQQDIRLPGKGNLKLPWREAGPSNHLDDQADSDQQVANKDLSLQVGEHVSIWALRAPKGARV